MNAQEYYHHVFERMSRCFQFNHYVIATGNELVAEGADPGFPAIAVPVNELGRLTLQRGLQVHLPIIGKGSESVLMPLDFEIFLENENHLLYTDKESQKRLFSQIVPVANLLEQILRSRGIPYLLDYTPSGGHILWHNRLGHRSSGLLKQIGFLEEDLINACRYKDPGDIRRWYGVSLDAALVFSGLGKIAEYLALILMEAFNENEERGLFPVTISDSFPHCINMDNTWNEGSPFMRSIRSPFSLHKKNREKYGKWDQPPLVDVIGTYYDGKRIVEESDLNQIIDCMWDLGKAAYHAQHFEGYIPCSNDSLIYLIREYAESDLFQFHSEFDRTEDIPRGQAIQYARREGSIPEWTMSILYHPNPQALQPKKLIWLVHDFLIHAHWKARHIGNILRDLYIDPSFGWTQDFLRYPAEEKANYWARTYGAVALWRTGQIGMQTVKV